MELINNYKKFGFIQTGKNELKNFGYTLIIWPSGRVTLKKRTLVNKRFLFETTYNSHVEMQNYLEKQRF